MVVPKIQSALNSEARNIINKAIEVLNIQGKTIQDLVAEGQLTEEQYAELITVINGFIKSGHVDKSDLTPEFKGEIEELSAQLAQKADENEVVKKGYGTLSDFDEDTRRMILDMEPGEIHAVLGIGNVKPENTNFFKPSGKNLFNKEVARSGYGIGTDGQIGENSNRFVSDYIEIDGDTYYSTPTLIHVTSIFLDGNKNVIEGSYSTSKTRLTPSNAKYAIYSADLSELDNFQVEKGSSSTEYEPYKFAIDETLLPNTNTLGEFMTENNEEWVI